MEAWSLHMLGGAEIRTGDLVSSREHLSAALGVFRDASDTAGITLVLDDLSSLVLAEGDPERAARIWGAARNLASTTGAQLASIVDNTLELEVRPNVRQKFAPERLDQLAREGVAMPLDQVIAQALQTPAGATD
jgi:hypothetical protein